MTNTNWWHDIVLYQVYPKSFQDTNNDGIGDIRGIISRLDYLKDLGVNMLWLNPIFESPQVDNGYDVSNYHTIDSEFGTMEDVEELINEAHQRDIKVIFDFVANHTSDQHPWFKEALKGKDNPYRDYYLWADGKGESGDELPNNWQSFFGGSVWERESATGQYYFHLFAKEMPDLNWENPLVREEINQIALFWLEKGIDGFRVDAFIHIGKEPGYPDVSWAKPGEIAIAEEFYAHQPNVNPYMKEWAETLRKEYPDIFIVGEAASSSPTLGVEYSNPEKGGCNSVITFRYFTEDWDAKDSRIPGNLQPGKLKIPDFKQVMTEWQEAFQDMGGPTLYWNNHDMARVVSRFGNDCEEFREQSAKMLAALMYLQKGLPIIMNGEEIGMKNLVFNSLDEFVAPESQEFIEKSREIGYTDDEILANLAATVKDASRGAMQWDQSEFAGFSTSKPWGGVNVEEKYNVLEQVSRETSVYNFYKQLISLKKSALFTSGSWQLLDTNHSLYVYQRKNEENIALVICNLTKEPQAFTLPQEFSLETYDILLENEGINHQDKTIHLSAYGVTIIQKQNYFAK
ncbi:oligo-1,6-glucosidase/alpha-glucosidase [Granulicatella balaenopterae]|uniref:Oligo-1,6-glucosidase/alpha-glucosidase n=1 Tax=Granulicatella balaenopterae TaxID=137733 RepID=A0A1H9HR85_9LACT|nr:alpha-glucosidase [Granulicatella balaenopterae]SEQ64859.1 oligo-1,6-glucosidase/alpha-glucosidase [Granulicatella balaenopterae]